MDKEIAVSICCITYNHAKYIGQCLDSLLSQKTSFRYEIIIHDDASTDETQNILKAYQREHPDIIRLQLERTNQFSQGKPSSAVAYLAAKGKYIAICEGDDFWSDCHKLQKQFDALEHNSSCHFSVHSVQNVLENGVSTIDCYPNFHIETGVIPQNHFLKMICEQYCFQTSSYFVRAKDIQQYCMKRPQYSTILNVGDEPMMLYFGSCGDVYYIDSIMSCRRLNSLNSWSSRNKNLGWRKSFERIRDIGRMMESYDEFTDYRFHDICQNRIDSSMEGQFGILQANKQYKMMLRPEYKELRKKWSVKFWILVLWRAYRSWKIEK